MNQSMAGEPIDNPSLVEGATVFDVAGEKVGTINAHDPQAGWLGIQQGWLFAHEVYVPLSLVVSQDSKGIYLNVSKEELKEDRWKVPPTADAMAATNPLVGADREMGVLNTTPDRLVTQGTDVIETTPHTITSGRAVIEQNPHTISQGSASIDQRTDTVTKGTDSIEPEV